MGKVGAGMPRMPWRVQHFVDDMEDHLRGLQVLRSLFEMLEEVNDPGVGFAHVSEKLYYLTVELDGQVRVAKEEMRLKDVEDK